MYTQLGRQTPLAKHPDIPWADTAKGRHPPGQTATAADSTHPTGMHSCFIIFLHDTNTLMMFLQIVTLNWFITCPVLLNELKNQNQPISKSVLTQLEVPNAMKNKVKDELLKNHTSVPDKNVPRTTPQRNQIAFRKNSRISIIAILAVNPFAQNSH